MEMHQLDEEENSLLLSHRRPRRRDNQVLGRRNEAVGYSDLTELVIGQKLTAWSTSKGSKWVRPRQARLGSS